MLNAALLLMLAIQVQNRCHSDFFQNSWALLKAARWGTSRFEHAAFAVREGDGGVNFVRWPGSLDSRAEYEGAIPPNAFAIVHTHPNAHPNPSVDDVRTAQRLGMPVYVVTRKIVSVTTGHESRMVLIGDWNPERCR